MKDLYSQTYGLNRGKTLYMTYEGTISPPAAKLLIVSQMFAASPLAFVIEPVVLKYTAINAKEAKKSQCLRSIHIK
jgi:hypothetical protein